ncbi:Uncharacterized protein PB7E8.02 [Grifola frondosa]|uniref:Uncharacterized protein PB7E8.02 n=1 Tax=Grifola frondosa TaxID=5627 RepID=A0A1C7MPC3_GRIFR|nr:Uncharacterized protein PB7E8.02 [Grifola frondosa]
MLLLGQLASHHQERPYIEVERLETTVSYTIVDSPHTTFLPKLATAQNYHQLRSLGLPSISLMQSTNYQHQPDDDDDDADRQNRFLSPTPPTPPTPPAPQANPQGAQAQTRVSWPPIRPPFSSAMRDSRFASTFEDDESEALSDVQDLHDPYDPYDDRYGLTSSSTSRGRTYGMDMTRSRSQSLATTRPGAIGSGLPGQNAYWNESASPSNPQGVPISRYSDFKSPGGSRYGSLGNMARSPSNGYSHGSITDHSNMSPFVRDVGQILLDEGSAFRELWAGMNPPRDGGGGGGSVGFNAPGVDGAEETSQAGTFHSTSFTGGSGLLLTDDDLASDLNMLSLKTRDETRSTGPPSADRVSPYQPLHLNIPGGGSYASRQVLGGSPSESARSGGSPSRGHLESFAQEHAFREPAPRPTQGLMARFVPGHGIQHIPEQGVLQPQQLATPVRSPTYAQAQRRASDAGKMLNELGKGVPLHSVPTSWPLFIIEFKAGRTDLFYCTDLTQDIRVGDLVIVEADRGKDLGKVVNDTITLAEVEAFQKQQKLMSVGHADPHGVPTSPTGGAAGAAKDIHPKMIYGKASHQELQGLAAKSQDEAKALELCRSKVRQRKLPMEVVDAEYQWDRRKLTFYFVAEKRIDFRELVRELFRLYKTRIWMASLGGAGSFDQ